ncbi:hypothetical protein R82265_HNDDMDAM_00747 [Fructobacillus cardui]|uniref:helix-turn-helix domain-containing protein n=1 Tax=Fructobacillus cardui TaxID=2893170 RepID=UPI002D946014|nr:hypothetical protein R82265_HNDDMDAM_00747 [Fructobacillus cardui]
MTTQKAIDTLEDDRLDFEKHRKKKRLTPEMLASVIGKSPSYVRQLLNGSAKGNVARKNLSKLFDFTDYKGDIWF